MKYVMVSIEEAKKIAKKDAVVLISVDDLETNDCNIEFKRQSFGECEKIIRDAETIAKVCDDFVNQLRVFSKKQIDVINYLPHGKLVTILLRE